MASLRSRLERVERTAFRSSGPTSAMIAIAAGDLDARIARLRERLLAEIAADGFDAVIAAADRDGSEIERAVLASIGAQLVMGPAYPTVPRPLLKPASGPRASKLE